MCADFRKVPVTHVKQPRRNLPVYQVCPSNLTVTNFITAYVGAQALYILRRFWASCFCFLVHSVAVKFCHDSGGSCSLYTGQTSPQELVFVAKFGQCQSSGHIRVRCGQECSFSSVFFTYFLRPIATMLANIPTKSSCDVTYEEDVC